MARQTPDRSAPQPAKRTKTYGRSGNPARNGRTNQPAAPRRRATLGDWISGARLRTLPLAIAPVVAGTGAGVVAIPDGPWHPYRALLALIVALALQIGVNYANDYSDGIRGTDQHRVGPARLTGSGLAKPRHVLIAALASFAVAAVAGLALVVITQQWWLLAVGAVAIVAAWFYTGGKHPYGYYGLGELFVFVFFGVVATAGSAYVQALTVNLEAWVTGAGLGLIACAVLMANNLRDVGPDRAAGKRTLAVLVGKAVGRVLFAVFLLVPFFAVAFFALLYPTAWLVFFALLAALPAVLIVATARTSRELITALQLASATSLLYGIGLGLAFAL
ncbi:1,4-dihydroxy-2-naphthoate polyprenyltransferase [Agromyces sp. SYSU T00194]|uniref:1,4-dihydroxy-2-naphthoate polyprenyltransferase n=1 Tax=Agromyces chitinivorans TaxID=3158560 RepID=UPI003398E98A